MTDLIRAREGLFGELSELLLVVGEPRPEASERERGAHEHGVADLRVVVRE